MLRGALTQKGATDEAKTMRRLSIYFLFSLFLASCSSSDGAKDAGASASDDAAADSAAAGVDQGDGAATDTGDDAATPGDAAPADTADAEPTEQLAPPDCGSPTFSEGGVLRRYPYLQDIQPTSGRIVWTSTLMGDGVVEIAADPAGPWRQIPAERELFDIARTNDVEDYYAYEARVAGLRDGWSYCYRVLHDGAVVADGLRLAAAWTDPARPLRILAFGDSGNSSAEQKAVRDTFMQQDFDVFLHLGDMAYGSGTFPEFEAHVFDIYRDLLHKTVTWPTMGNHEYKTDGGRPYLDVYYLPEMALVPEAHERYYSFDYGDVHMVSFESNDAPLLAAGLAEVQGIPNMLNWLRDDLAASDKPWKIVFFHHPPYSSSDRGPNHSVRNQILPILEEHGVDLVLTGHDHHYERTVPIWQGGDGSATPGALTYIVAGAGGAGLRDIDPEWWTAGAENRKHSFVSMTIDGCTLVGEAIALDGEVVDAFTLDGCQN